MHFSKNVESLWYDFIRLRWLKTSENEVTRRAERMGTAAIDEGNSFEKKFSIFSIEHLDLHDFGGPRPQGPMVSQSNLRVHSCLLADPEVPTHRPPDAIDGSLS